MLRLLAGFERPDEGRILIDGATWRACRPIARPVNMMFQSYALFPHMSVADNVAFGLQARTAGRAREIDDARRGDARPRASSAGSRAGGRASSRAASSSASRSPARSIKEPKLLLLDEPLTALDRKLREETRFELVRIQERVGITFLMVTHDQEEAMSMASRIAVMDAGRIAQIGTPHEVYERRPAASSPTSSARSISSTGACRGATGGWHLHRQRRGRRALVVAHDAALAPGTRGRGRGAAGEDRARRRVAPERRGQCARRHGAQAVAYRGEASTYRVELASGKLVRVTLPNQRARAAAASRPAMPSRSPGSASAALVLEA